ncbi:MAG TPA: acyltransferase [Stellaceae bacterium]|nr:acyltransferase [Stellaceae bacterium]
MDRRNNFDALRLLAASSVILTHAFLLAEGTQDRDPLVVLTLHQCPTGLVGVFVFFAISGFLVTQSWEQTRSLPRYFLKRGLRIYPGLAVCILVLALVVGPAITTLPLRAYFADSGTHDFVVDNLLLQTETKYLPGVAFGPLTFNRVIDVPLWTLPLEVTLYGMVALLGLARLIRLPVLVGLMAIGLASIWFEKWIAANLALGFLDSVVWMLPFFVAGMLAYKLRDSGIFSGRVALLALVGLVASVPLQSFIPLFAVFGSYLALYLALHPSLPVLPAARFGDLSYGLYIYGWPVQQTILYLHPGLSWWALFPVSMLATAGVAFVSWHLVEKRALGLKPRLATQMKPAPA